MDSLICLCQSGELEFVEVESRHPVRENPLMNFVVCSVAALSVASLFYYWRSYHETLLQREKKLRERVTYMLWVMVNATPDNT